MYYKITNEDSEVYKQMSDLLQEEKRIEEKNVKMIKEKIPYEWEISYGHAGQQNFRRTTSYTGFVFTEPEKVDKAWKLMKDGKTFIPNTRTKVGREMSSFLLNGLEKSWYEKPLEILGCNGFRQHFAFPFVQKFEGIIRIWLDDQYKPVPLDVIEITSKEFEKIRDKHL